MKEKYSGKVAVITGAAGVICSEIAIDLANKGAFVVLVDLMIQNAEKVALRLANGIKIA